MTDASLLRQALLLPSLAVDRLAGRRRGSRTWRAAHAYWAGAADEHWKSNSHFRDGLGAEAFDEVGRDHLALYQVFARALPREVDPGVVVEWGCGGGANAIAFAPLATEFIGVDVSAESLAECADQVGRVCSTPVRTRTVDLADPAAAATGLDGTCDTFLCLYVIELTSGPEAALDIVRIAERLLKPGGLAMIQVKYHTADLRTRGRHRRNYASNVAATTTFAIDEFWLRAQDCGLQPRLITLVPQNRLDVRYAYYALTKL